MPEGKVAQLQREHLAHATDEFYKYHPYGLAHIILTEKEWKDVKGEEILSLKSELAFLRGVDKAFPQAQKTWLLEGEFRGFIKGFCSALISVIAALSVHLVL